MFNIEQFPFLHALGYAIGHSLWQMSLLWLVYTAIIHVHQWTSSQRYNLAVTNILIGFAAFVLTFFYYSGQVLTDQESFVLATIPANIQLGTTSNKWLFVYHSVMATLKSLAPYFSCAYLVVTMLLSVRLANGFSEVKKLRSQDLGKPTAGWRLFVNEHAALLGIKKPVRLHTSNLATSPLTIGFWKPFILIPLASINQLTPQQTEAVLLHELAHIRRNDYLLNILLQLVEIIIFFNPFMRLLLKQARLERENSCDDYVLQFQYNATDYAKALLAIQQHSVESILALGTNNSSEYQLLTRIKRMLAPERKAFNYRQQVSLLFIITILGLGFTVVTPKITNKKLAARTIQPFQARVSPDSVIVAKPVQPEPVDLIKNLNQIQRFSEMIAEQMVDNNNASDRIEKAAEEIAKKIEPQAKKIEALALEIEKFHLEDNINTDALAKSGLLFSEFGKTDWLYMLPPVLDESKKIIPYLNLFGIAKIPPPLTQTPPLPPLPMPPFSDRNPEKPNRKQASRLQKLPEHFLLEQTLIPKIRGYQQQSTDSIHIRITSKNRSAAIARIKKQAAIAPFQLERAAARADMPASIGMYYSYSNGGNNDENSDNKTFENQGPSDQKGVSASGCDCPAEVGINTRTVTVFNGKKFAEKVKQVWAEAKTKHGWTDEMQQKVVYEIEQELKGIQQLEIKTRIAYNLNNNRTIIIELKGIK